MFDETTHTYMPFESGQLVYLKIQGLTTIDKETKQAKVLIEYAMKEKYHNIAYLKYYRNQRSVYNGRLEVHRVSCQQKNEKR